MWFPVPVVESLAELNTRLAAADAAEDDRRIDGRAQTVGEAGAPGEFQVGRPVGAYTASPGLDLGLGSGTTGASSSRHASCRDALPCPPVSNLRSGTCDDVFVWF